jgi:hypothetical protein
MVDYYGAEDGGSRAIRADLLIRGRAGERHDGLGVDISGHVSAYFVRRSRAA